jgi:hypothetical protein
MVCFNDPHVMVVAEWLVLVVVEDQSGKEYKMDDYQVRFPTNVEDVARVLYDLSRRYTFFHIRSATHFP